MTGMARIADEPGQGLARVEIAAALLGVVQRQQHLAGDDAVAVQRLRPGAGERNLADGSGGLAVLELQRRLRQPQQRAPERDRAGGDDQHVGAALVQRGDVLDERVEPLLLQGAGRRGRPAATSRL